MDNTTNTETTAAGGGNTVSSSTANTNTNNTNTMISSFTEDPSSYLTMIRNSPTTQEGLWNLGGAIASCIKEETASSTTTTTGNTTSITNNHDTSSKLAWLYLQAVAKQLAAGTKATDLNTNGGMMMRTRLNEIFEAVEYAIFRCKHVRQSVCTSGIIPALAAFAGLDGNNNDDNNMMNKNRNSNVLSNACVELVHACYVAGQHRYGERMIIGTWPRPTAASNVIGGVRQVLRYYYLRGSIHMECQNYILAVRCFWTCLSIPADIVSSIQLAAWKKLMLVQCLLLNDDDFPYTNNNHNNTNGGGGPSPTHAMGGNNNPSLSYSLLANGPLSLPKALPSCLGRFLNVAWNHSKKKATTAATIATGTTTQQQHHQHHHQQQPEDVHPAGRDPITYTSSSRDRSSPDRDPSNVNNILMDHTTPGACTAACSTPPPSDNNPENSFDHTWIASLYIDLVQAFLQRDRTKFVQIVQTHSIQFSLDATRDILNQCEKALLHRQIWHISRIYAVIPLPLLCKKMGISDYNQMKTLLIQCSMEQSWDIQLQEESSAAGPIIMVQFTRQKNKHMDNSSSLENNVQALIKLTNRIQKLDAAITTSPSYHAIQRNIGSDTKMGPLGIPRGVEDL